MSRHPYAIGLAALVLYLALGFFLASPSAANPTASPYLGAVQKMYIGYYQRPADPGGLLYWSERLQGVRGSLDEIIDAFANSPESKALYGDITSESIGNVVDSIYAALFNRPAEAEGKSYWVSGFNSGRFTAAAIILNVLDGAQNDDLQSVANKLVAANSFTGAVTSLQADYSGNLDAAAARTFLATVTSDSATLPSQADANGFVTERIDPVTTAQSGLVRSTAPDASASEIDALVRGNSAFAIDLYRQVISQADGNLFYSPYSVSLALALAYAGARGDTEAEMAAVLHFGWPQDRLHVTFNALDLILANRAHDAATTDGAGFRLDIANAIWGEKTHAFRPTYLDVLAVNYGAGLRLLDFVGKPDASGKTINAWVANETEDRIQNLVPPGTIDPQTRLVLTNAIYFRGAWDSPFPQLATRPGTFRLPSGQGVTADFMSQTHRFGYASGPGYAAVELPYSGRSLGMVLLVPDIGTLHEFESRLTAEGVSDILLSLNEVEVSLTMPKFSFAADLGLTDRLRKLGMTTAFSDVADFSGMDGMRDLFITDVLHKAWVAVNEEGTEAAAATGVIIGTTAMPSPLVSLTADRPFLFLIRDVPTRSILFVGRVVNPLE
jgi:serpin B